MTGRQALRAVSFPAIFGLAVYFFWTALKLVDQRNKPGADIRSTTLLKSSIPSFLVAGLLLGITFYTYLPARGMWVIFPVFLLYLLLINRPLYSKTWPGMALMLLVAVLVAAPLFVFLATNPGSDARLDRLSGSLEEAARGNFDQLIANSVTSLQLFTSKGDVLSGYNIPGRPFLTTPMAILFIIGLPIAVWWLIAGRRDRADMAKSSAVFFSLLWLLVGLSPALITGPDASTTRIIGLLPVLYLFPAIPLAVLLENQLIPKRVTSALVAALFGIVLTLTVRDYFVIWANDPEVRVQYETTLVSALSYLDDRRPELAAISTTTPDRYHSPSVALMTTENPERPLRWFNGQHSLIAPQESHSTFIFTGFAPLNPDLEEYFNAELQEIVPLRPTDIDRPLTVYAVDNAKLTSNWQNLFQDDLLLPAGVDQPILFGESAELLGYDLQTPTLTPGSEFRLATLWRVIRPLEEAVLFTQVLGQDGLPLAQADRLDAPGYYWMPDDLFIQMHRFQLPESIDRGEYSIILGMYTRPDLVREQVFVDGVASGDHVMLPPLNVVE
jgi:hypothetical protein